MVNSQFLIAAQLALMELDIAVAETKSHALKESTKKNLLSQLAAYEKFCHRYMLEYFLCDNKQLYMSGSIGP